MKLKIPYIVIALLLAFNNVFIRFRIGGIISFDRALEFLAFFILFKPYLNAIRTNRFFRFWNVFLIGFTILLLLVNLRFLIYNEITTRFLLIDVFKGFSFIVYSALFFLIAQKNINYVKIILIGHLVICGFSLLQHPISPIAGSMLEVKKALFASVEGSITGKLEKENAYIAGGYSDRFRMAGPFSSTITFTYFAIASFCLSFYMYIRTRKKFYLVVLGTVFLCSIFSQTRSLLLGELVIIFGYLFFAPQRKRSMYQLTMIIGGVLLALFTIVGQDLLLPKNSRVTSLSSGGESDMRPLLWFMGVTAAVTHPLGVSEKDYKIVKQEMYAKYRRPALLHLTAHNGIINIGIYYSIFGYILLLLFVKFLLMHNKTSNHLMKYFYILCLVGYGVHVTFHNNIIFDADYPFFMVLMLVGLRESDKENTKNQLPFESL